MIVAGPDHGRADGGLRHRGDAADRLRRGRQLHRLELHRPPDPDRLGDARVRPGGSASSLPRCANGASTRRRSPAC
jgi:hypothetical protein